MLKRVLAGKGDVLLCGTCMNARGLREEDVMDGTRRSTMGELTDNPSPPIRCWFSEIGALIPSLRQVLSP
jgi:hypothetical protein